MKEPPPPAFMVTADTSVSITAGCQHAAAPQDQSSRHTHDGGRLQGHERHSEQHRQEQQQQLGQHQSAESGCRNVGSCGAKVAMHFTQPQQLLQVLADLEESNLFLIQVQRIANVCVGHTQLWDRKVITVSVACDTVCYTVCYM